MEVELTEEQVRKNLLSNIDVLSDTFKRNKDEIEKVVLSLTGKKEDMMNSFLIQLNLPLNIQSLVVLNSIIKQPKPLSMWQEFLKELKSFFK